MIDEVELARSLFGKEVNKDATTTFTGTALTSSSSGIVSVQIDGGAVVELPTTVVVSEDDTVIVTKTNNLGTVTGVVGGGDAQSEAIYTAIAAGGGSADEHFYSDTNGAHITNDVVTPSNSQATINSSGLTLENAGKVVAKFSPTKIELGTGYPSASISIADDAGYLAATGDDKKGFAIGGTAGNPLQIVSPNDADDLSRGYSQISMLANGSVGITTHKTSSTGTYYGGAGVNMTYDSSSGVTGTTLSLAADTVSFVQDSTGSVSDCAVIGRGIVRQIFVVSGTVDFATTGSSGSTKTYFPTTCLTKPVCIPYSSGYWDTQAPSYVGKTYLEGTGYNFSGASHSGVLQYLCIEYYGINAAYTT